MSEGQKRWTRAELLDALEKIWGRYVSLLAQLTGAEQKHFAQRQGYNRPQDLLAHLAAWMEETVRVAPYLLRDERPPHDYANDAEFNARAVEDCQTWTRAQVEAKFEKQRQAFVQLLASLPDEAIPIQRVYRWFSGTIIGHYEEHRLPNGPQI